jgi:SAM-dependent methyltransferase
MDINIKNIFEETVNQDLISIIISNSKEKNKISKIKIRPVILKGELYFQVSEYIGNKIFHNNYQKNLLIDRLPSWFDDLFRQAEILTKNRQVVILISKKGKATVKTKQTGDSTDSKNSSLKISPDRATIDALQHNKKKNYILEEGTALPFLVDLGVITKDGAIIKAKMDKYRQINRFLEYIEDVLPYLDHTREITILDFGCGKSYLTFAMYYFLKELKGYHINVIGLDLKMDVILQCNQLSEKYGYDKLKFIQGDIASYEGKSSVDMVVTLHACDTATDHALYKAVTWGAKVILSVPCCQHELNGQIDCEMLKPVLKYGIIRERMSALITDALRAELLEIKGYRVQLLEFIDMEHTPKNILIRAVKRNAAGSENEEKNMDLMKCMDFLKVSPCLQRLFQEESLEEGK